MIEIPAGWFEMGSRRGNMNESPPHKVWIDALLMDRFETTQEQYDKLLLGNPSHFVDPKFPVHQVRWSDAALYCNARSRAEGLQPCYEEKSGACDFAATGYRLPTEAEWEYACRAGTSSDYSFGSDPGRLGQYAWYAENSTKRAHPVGEKKPNGWGLFDMYGNVAEWCNDAYDANYYKQTESTNPVGPSHGDLRVLRGGSWSSSATSIRSSYREGEVPGFQDACFAKETIGFRCVKRDKASR
jgi:formylglycine-generating enzyme required for sulfatase activity